MTYLAINSFIAPKLSLKIHELGSQNDLVPLNELMAKYVIPHYALRARRKGYEVSVVKAQMDILGMAGGPVRPPLVNVTDEEMSELRTMLESWGPIL